MVTGGIIIKENQDIRGCFRHAVVFTISDYRDCNGLLPYFEIKTSWVAPTNQAYTMQNNTIVSPTVSIKSELIVTVPITKESEDVMRILALEKI